MQNHNLGDGLVPGTRLQELEIVRELGSGGFGITYLARDLSLDRLVAVKEYLPRDWGVRRADGSVGARSSHSSKDYAWGLRRFLKEARILAGLNDPGIVRVYRIVEARGTAYIVMEHVEGRSLKRHLNEFGPMPEEPVRLLLEGMAAGLAVVHGAGLLHRDVTPGNVMLRENGTPVLIDFGAARQHMGRQSRSLTAVLTPGYAPPEQYYAKGRQGPWTDVYALGAVAYEALSGRVPDEAPGRALADELPPLEKVAAGPVSAELTRAVMAALAMDPTSRPQTVTELMEMLGDGPAKDAGSQAGTEMAVPVAAGAVSKAATTRARRSERERRPRWPLWSVGAGVAVLTAGFLLWPRDGEVVVGDLGAQAEESLSLSLSDRDLVQRGLAVEGHDPGERGGFMGRRTRDAISRWQLEKGVEATGYLTMDAAEFLRNVGEEAERADSLAAAARRDETARRAAQADSAAKALRAEARARTEAEGLAAAERADSLAAARQRAEEARRAAQADSAAEAQRPRAEEVRRPTQADQLAAQRPGLTFRDCAACPEMVVIKPGRFRMGSPVWEEGSYDDEGPQRYVTIANAFAMGVHEVTFDEWTVCARNGGCGGRVPANEGWGEGRRPVINVSWEDAEAYVAWLSRKSGEEYRLPSEAEWEYAARAGTETARHWGQSSSDQCRYGNGADVAFDKEYPDTDWAKVACDDSYSETAPVGTYSWNAWGLHDMLGNVWEWTADCWHGNYEGAPTDGSVWPGGDCTSRVLRGGSWEDPPEVIRSAYRLWALAGDRVAAFGFRVARTIESLMDGEAEQPLAEEARAERASSSYREQVRMVTRPGGFTSQSAALRFVEWANANGLGPLHERSDVVAACQDLIRRRRNPPNNLVMYAKVPCSNIVDTWR